MSQTVSCSVMVEYATGEYWASIKFDDEEFVIGPFDTECGAKAALEEGIKTFTTAMEQYGMHLIRDELTGAARSHTIN